MGMDMYGDILFRPSLEMIPIVLSASAPLHTYTYISLSLSLSLFFFPVWNVFGWLRRNANREYKQGARIQERKGREGKGKKRDVQ